MSKHTPGPWYATGKLTRYVEARIDGGLIQEVAACGPTKADGGYGPQQEANARLIAAAPDLLEALKELSRSFIGTYSDDQRSDDEINNHREHWERMARAAIAKATGEQA